MLPGSSNAPIRATDKGGLGQVHRVKVHAEEEDHWENREDPKKRTVHASRGPKDALPFESTR